MLPKIKKNRKPNTAKNIFLLILFGGLFLVIIIFLVKTNLRISQRRAALLSQLDSLSQQTRVQEEKNRKLKAEIKGVGDRDYLEKVAREQLNLKAPNEEVIVISKEESNSPLDREQEEKPFWDPRGWWEWLRSKTRD